VHHLRPPAEGPHVRVDTGVRQGDAITVHYDPMIAKLIVWDRDRPAAVRRLEAALAQYEVAGVETNLGLLRRVAAHPDFLAGDVDTGFLDRHPEVLASDLTLPPFAAMAAAAAAILADWGHAAPGAGADAHSPWGLASAWRLNGDGHQDLTLHHAGIDHALRAFPRPDGTFALEAGGRRGAVGRRDGDALAIDGVRCRVPVVRDRDTFWVIVDGAAWPLRLVDPLTPPRSEGAGGDRLVATMPGRIVGVQTEPGAAVKRGEVLLVLEAMKVQMRLTAPRDGVVAAVRAVLGDLVDDGDDLISFEPLS